ncbi:MAG: hypothetical protein KF797_05485 [Flavobacteriales bacterium]|nr:hypothetical protein [Flavobacteriales bacterium]
MLTLRPIAIWLLLLPLALTVVPRGMLHQCVHEAVVYAHDDADGTGGDCAGHAEQRTPDPHHARVEADCPICDAHVLVGVPGAVLTELAVEAVASPAAVVLAVALHEVPHPVPGARGPPAIA